MLAVALAEQAEHGVVRLVGRAAYAVCNQHRPATSIDPAKNGGQYAHVGLAVGHQQTIDPRPSKRARRSEPIQGE
jgi:hypothetical protein